MKITWSSLLRLHKFGYLALILTLLSLPLIPQAEASKNGTLTPANSFAVGFTFVLNKMDQVCSGSLISPTVIVTAAHCVQDSEGNQSTNYVFSAPGVALDAPINPTVTQPKVLQVIKASSSDALQQNQVDDITFLQLDSPLASSGFIRVATQQEVLSLRDKYEIQGYGFGHVFEENTEYSIFARMYKAVWNKPKEDSKIAEITSTTSTACSGDSGGPVTARLESGEEVLVASMAGAAAVINRCGTSNNGVYSMRATLIYPYLALAAEALKVAVPTPKPAPKVYKITCVKGKTKKYIRGSNPKCPIGYKQKAKVLVSSR